MAPVEITEAEIIAALRESMDNPDLGPADAFTRGEIAAAAGWGLTKTAQYLQRIKAKGRLEVVAVRRKGIDDRWAVIPGYRFLKQ